jgi:hypothetical protein
MSAVPRCSLLRSAIMAQEAPAEGPARFRAPTVSLIARGAACTATEGGTIHGHTGWVSGYAVTKGVLHSRADVQQ